MDIQIPQILFQAFNFLVVLGSLSYLLYRPILKLFEERSQRIAEGQKAAEEAIIQREKIDELKREAQAKMDQKANKIIAQATEEALVEKQQIIADAKKKAKKEVEILKQKWADEKAQMLKGINDQLVDAVLQVSSKVISSSLTADQHSKLIDQELRVILKQI